MISAMSTAQAPQYKYCKNMKILIKIWLKLIPDDTLYLLEEECFKEMVNRKLIVWEEDINNIEQN
ncbi:hypothetical protein COO91_11085 (plasmid) [Nostoc flagelliforme CCNUN1]|uniref:Uncharacterized protein n=2 Tax=Nostoc flagelliforme TaxID=1306274 RepID=A0A2K8TAW7_9NOSO|nr:hypothetical protein COO91_11085 [Nostoc flagelliforme CCNUN1]